MILPKTYLTEDVSKKVILTILTQEPAGNTSEPRHKELATWATEKHRQSKIKNIELSSLRISDKSLIGDKLISRYNTLGSLLDALYNLTKQESKYGKDAELASKIQKITLEILEDLKAKEDGTERQEESDLQAGMDWTAEKSKRLAAARETGEAISDILNKFYDDYYSVEYAKGTNGTNGDASIITKLKSLDKILIPEFNKLGYSPEVNPFASFLKILIDKNSGIFEKLTFNTYGAIHNSFIAGHITGNELGQKFAETNILFCEDLYNKNGLDMIKYLDLQKQTRNAQKNSEYANDTNLVSKVFIQQNQEASAASYTSKVDKLLDPNLQGIIQPGSDKARLRSIPEILELYRYIFKDEAERTKKKVDLKTVNDIIDTAEKQNVILDMIKLILAQNEYAGSAKYAEEAQKIESWLDKQNYTYTKKGIADSRKILLNYALNAEALSLIIINLKNHIDESSENTN